MIIRALRAADVDAVVEFSVRAWRPAFESFTQAPHWEAIQAAAVRAACQDEKNRT